MQIAFGIVRGSPVAVGEHGVHVADLAEAVAAERERVRQPADAVLAGVEVRAPVEAVVRVAVGDDHLAEARPVQDRAVLLAVAEAHVGQHEAVDRVQRDVQRASPATRSTWPSSVKPGPSGWTMSSRAMSSRQPPTASSVS